jgi:hypothetical protein
MIDPNIGKTLGLRDMHPMQVKMLMEFIDLTIQLSSMANDMEIVEETEAAADELIKIFGGNGVKVTIDTDY